MQTPRAILQRSAGPALVFVAALAPTAISADPVADFYKGKTLTVMIGVSAGGEYDLHARVVSRHIGKHIPGKPMRTAVSLRC